MYIVVYYDIFKFGNRFKSNVISSKLNALAFTDTFSSNDSLGSTLGML